MVGVGVRGDYVVEGRYPRVAQIVYYGVLRLAVAAVYKYGVGGGLNEDSVSLSDVEDVDANLVGR